MTSKVLGPVFAAVILLYPAHLFAQETCPLEKYKDNGLIKIDFTIDAYFEEEYLPSGAFPGILNVADRMRDLIGAGCESEVFLAQVLDRLEAYEAFDRALQGTMGQVDRGALDAALELYIFGRTKPMISLILKLEELEDEGRVWATHALALLGTDGPHQLTREFEDVRRSLDFRLDSVEGSAARPLLLDSEEVPREIVELQTKLTEAAPERFNSAEAVGYPFASLYKAFGTPSALAPCSTEGRDLALSRMTPELLSELSTWLRSVDGKKKDERTQEAVQTLSLAVANIYADCAYATPGPSESFGLNDPQTASEFLQIALRAPEGGFGRINSETYLALALDIENSELEGRHTAAARALIHHAGSRFKTDFADTFYSDVVPRFSRNTIREAQRLLATYDLYNSGLDGIPGRGFERGFNTINFNSLCAGALEDFAAMCSLPNLDEVEEAAWLAPFLTAPPTVGEPQESLAASQTVTLSDYPGPDVPFHFERFLQGSTTDLVAFGSSGDAPAGFEVSANLPCEELLTGSLFLAKSHAFLAEKTCLESVLPKLAELDASPTLGLPGAAAPNPLDRFEGDIVVFYRGDLYTPDWSGTFGSLNVGNEFFPDVVKQEFGELSTNPKTCFDWQLAMNVTFFTDREVYVTTKECFEQLQQDVEPVIGTKLILGLPPV